LEKQLYLILSAYKSYFKIQVTKSTSRKDIERYVHMFGGKVKGKKKVDYNLRVA
jgi:hypothetical protein